MKSLLEVRGLVKVFGGLVAVNKLNFDVFKGEILGLIGPNGAGKTTVLNLTTGFLKPSKGKIFFEGQDITYFKTNRRATKGIVRTFQANNLFREMTVIENLMIACYNQQKRGFWGPIVTMFDGKKEGNIEQKTANILKYTGLTPFKNELSKNLPHGHQRVLGIAIALSANPKLLLLDEPLTGMIAEEAVTIVNLIMGLREWGITVVIVEHNVKAIMRLCDRIVVIDFGSKIAEGLPKEIENNKHVIEAYLGAEQGDDMKC